MASMTVRSPGLGNMVNSPEFERPATRGMTSSAGNRPILTPMPDYMRPVTKSASRKWKKLHEDHMMHKLIAKRQVKKELNQITKQEAFKQAKKIPIDLLAKDWLSENNASVETRAYVVDKILPTVILGVEKLITEVERKGMVDNESQKGLNPINFLAQYLLRNNPRYSNFSETSQYIRGIRQVHEELRKQLFDIEDNKLAKLKAEARHNREEREKAARAKILENERRMNALQLQFGEWEFKKSKGKVELALIQNALRSFSEVTAQFPVEMRPLFELAQEVEPTDESKRTVNKKEFVTYLTLYTESLPNEIFDHFLKHLSLSAKIFRAQIDRDERKLTLTQLFVTCDNAGVGVIDRHRILELLELFWDKARDQIRHTLRDPRNWPVVEAQEVDMDSTILSDDEDEQKRALQDETDEQNYETIQEPPEGHTEFPLLDTAAMGLAEETPRTDDNEESDKEEKGVSEKVAEDGVQESGEPGEETETNGKDESDGTGEKNKEKDAAENGGDEVEPGVVEEKVEEDEEDGKQGEEMKEEGQADGEDQETEDAPAENEEENEELGPKEDSADAEHAEAETHEQNEELGTKELAANEDSEKDMDEQNGLHSGKLVDDPKVDEELALLMDDLQKYQDSAVTFRPPMTQQSKVSFAEGTAFERERTAGLIASRGGSRSLSVISAFDESTLLVSQFVQLVETFLGDEPYMAAFNQLIQYIQEAYMETEGERLQRLLKMRREAQSAHRKALLNSLFELWDNDGSGYLDLEEVEEIIKKYKDGAEIGAFAAAKKEFKQKTRYHDNKLSKREFRDLVHQVVENMGQVDTFDYFIEFLLNSVERSYAERVRGEARKKWLQAIITAGEVSGIDMDPVYKAVFQALYKDAEAHGNHKRISAYIALLEKNEIAPPSRGDYYLRYVASTPESAPFILGKCLFKDMKGISFASVESGKPIHVPRVSNHGNIQFWNTERSEQDREGSFIVVPLKDVHKQVFGLLGIDTLNDPHNRAIFITHEIQFFQGIAKAFSISHHKVGVRQKTMRISESAVSWICRRCSSIHDITVYMVEPDQKGRDYILRKMMTIVDRHPHLLKKPAKLERRDNLFRDYLFKCVDNSESVTADAYGERHLSVPLRNDRGIAIVVMDISIGGLKKLSKLEGREVTKMLKLLQMAYQQISRESRAEDDENSEKPERQDTRAEILFDRLMLNELRQNVSKLDPTAYAELKSYNEPPEVIQRIIRSVLSIFYPEKAVDGEFNVWANCKQYINPELNHNIIMYDPTADDEKSQTVPIENILKDLDEVPHGQVIKHGSKPAQLLFNWVFVCVSLLEHSGRNKVRRRPADEEAASVAADAQQNDAEEENNNENSEASIPTPAETPSSDQ